MLVCVDCVGRAFETEQAAAGHENSFHDGAQTCWDLESLMVPANPADDYEFYGEDEF